MERQKKCVIVSSLIAKQKVLMSGHDDFITCIALSREGHLIASGQQGNCADVLLWDVDTREVHAGEN